MVDPPVPALAFDDAPSLRPLTSDALEAVQAASFRTLAETGVAVGSPAVLARLAEAGARVDGDRVPFPRGFVEAAIRVSEDDPAVGPIGEVGPGGNFLAEDHTIAHLRELWWQRPFDQGTWEDWEAAGHPDPRSRARERVRTLFASHVVPSLPDGVPAELDRIIAAAAAEARIG
jgi:trimethylamine:corrinoid methyltransferase-like protein